MRSAINDITEIKNNETLWKEPVGILQVSKVCFQFKIIPQALLLS